MTAMHLVDQAFCPCCAGESAHEHGCPRSETFGRAPVMTIRGIIQAEIDRVCAEIARNHRRLARRAA